MNKPLETMKEEGVGETQSAPPGVLPAVGAKLPSLGTTALVSPVAQIQGASRPHRNGPVDDDDDEGFFQRNRLGLIIGVVVLIGVGWAVSHRPSGKSQPVRKAPEPPVVRIVPVPPPPPPKIPPPAKIQPPKEEKLPEQAPMAAPEAKPEEAKPKPVDKPPEGLGTNIKGPGDGIAGLSSGGGNGVLGGTGTGKGGGSMSAWYAGQVQAKIADELRRNDKTRKAAINGLKFSVSVDATGRISRVALLGSTGDGALDKAIESEVLAGMRLKESPPGGKPMTIKMVLNARRQR